MTNRRVLLRSIPLSIAWLPMTASLSAAVVHLTDATDKPLGDVVETETSVAVSPLDPRIIVVSNIRHPTANNTVGVTAWISLDGGLTWTDHTAAGPFENADPAAAISGIAPDGKIVLAHNAGSPVRTMRTHEKAGPGAGWTQIDLAFEDQDKPHLTSDNSPYSPRQFDMFCVWVLQEVPSEQTLRFTRRDRFTGAWGTAAPIPTPQDFLTRNAPCIQTGRVGTAYCVWEIAVPPQHRPGCRRVESRFLEARCGGNVLAARDGDSSDQRCRMEQSRRHRKRQEHAEQQFPIDGR